MTDPGGFCWRCYAGLLVRCNDQSTAESLFSTRLSGFLHEQRLSVQACFTSGLLLTGTLYLFAPKIFREALCWFRLAW